MGRVYSEVKVNGRSLWTLFDTGARNNYIARNATSNGMVQRVQNPRTVAIGGTTRNFSEICNIVDGLVEGKPVNFQAWVIDDLGLSETGRPIEMLFGAIEMQHWSIIPVPHEERLDLSHYPKEFIEY